MFRLAKHAALTLVCTVPIAAQMRPVVDTIPASAAPALASIVAAYQKEVATNPRDAGLWHDLGINAWRLSSALQRGGTAGTEPARIGRLADSALAMAAALELSSVQYQLDMAWRLQAARIAVTRVGSRRYLERAVNAARVKQDPLMLAVAALEYGRTYWWRFDAVENRHQFTGVVAPRSVSDAMNPTARARAILEEQNAVVAAAEANFVPRNGVDPAALVGKMGAMDLNRLLINVPVTDAQSTGTFNTALNLLRTISKSLPGDLSGQPELERASALFVEAYQAMPSYPGAFRSVAMTWVARGAWANLERFASAHVRAFPRDSIARLALGLAQYRQGKLPAARMTFDSALALVGTTERERLTAWRRVLPPHVMSQIKDDERAAKEALYWRTALPFWSDSTRDPRIEFFARVAHAELRWSVEEFGLSGADSDRGDVFIRHGPPKQIIGFGASVDDYAADAVSFWIYQSGLIFAFSGMPTFSVMRTAEGDRPTVAELNARFPVGWDNIDAPQIDSLQSQVARFRGAADSVDLAIAVDFPAPDSLVRTMSIAAPVRKHLWLSPTGSGTERHTSSTLTSAMVHLFRERVAPSTYVYRAESFAETSTRGGRVSGIIDATGADFPPRGFGLSDILIAGAGADSVARGRRWSDLPMSSSTARVARNAVTFVWENYEFGERTGQSEYDATLTIKNRKGGAGEFAGEIIGALARIARVERAPDQVKFSFSRTVPFAAAFADWITVQLPNAPKGEYDVTLTVTDRVTQKQAVRSTRLTIRE